MSSTGFGQTPNRMVSATSGAKITPSRQPMSRMPAMLGRSAPNTILRYSHSA